MWDYECPRRDVGMEVGLPDRDVEWTEMGMDVETEMKRDDEGGNVLCNGGQNELGSAT